MNPHIAIAQGIQEYKAEDENVSQCRTEESDILKYWRLKKSLHKHFLVLLYQQLELNVILAKLVQSL